jgi:hypothetical protein
MKLTIDRSIERQLQGQQSALKRLNDLRRIAKENRKAIDWSVSPEAEDVLRTLIAKFG